jgi:hypothetical protein|nr:MAG TPA: hypothetical protein [Caudoviricetes sp.]
METNKIITLLGKELTISHTYQMTKSRVCGYPGTVESIDIDRKELTSLIKSEEDAKQLAKEMSEYTYNEVYRKCKSRAEKGHPLYAYRTLMIYVDGESLLNSGSISAAAMYSELDKCSKIGISSYIDRLPEEGEDGEEIPQNVTSNKAAAALASCEFWRAMSERELIDFERLEEEARKNYKRLHPEEFED